jgi:hypothetical protein
LAQSEPKNLSQKLILKSKIIVRNSTLNHWY